MKKIVLHIKVIILFCSAISAVEFSKLPSKENAVLLNDRYYPRYHLAPPFGWMNDPNGFCVYNNEYHLFYQHTPQSSQGDGLRYWGHATSKDLYNWKHQPIALSPDEWYDESGVFSGSAIVEGGIMYLIYTGQVYNSTSGTQKEYQALALSADGETFVKYELNPVISGPNLQPNIRDPKIWKHENTYYMVLGNSYNNDTLGRVLLFSSANLYSWEQVSVIGQSDGSLGYMWECPDFFELDGKYVLLFSPQGIVAQGDKYKNLYQTGYIVGNFDYVNHTFTPITQFMELDHGHDFYATQTTLDMHGRRIVIAWFDMWETNYPEKNDGFAGTMTIPRLLSLNSEGRIIQKPLEGTSRMRGRSIQPERGSNGRVYTLTNKSGEIDIQADSSRDLKLYIESGSVVVSIAYNAANGQVTLDRGGVDGVRRTDWRPSGALNWKLYIDASSVELFCGEGEVTFSSRFFPNGDIRVRLGSMSRATTINVFSVFIKVMMKKNNLLKI